MHGKVRLWGRGNDDYICGGGRAVAPLGAPARFPCAGRPANASLAEFVTSDHVFVTVRVRVQ